MQSDTGTIPGQWPGGNPSISSENSPIMNATSGPLEQYYMPGRTTPTPTPSPNELRPPHNVAADAARSASRSPIRHQLGTGLQVNHTLSNAKSTPHLVPSRPAGSVRNMASKFDQAGTPVMGQPPNLTVRTGQDRQRRQLTKSPKSPTKGVVKLQKRMPGQLKSPVRSTAGSFGSSSTSFGSTSTITSTKSQPHAAFSPKQPPQGPYLNSRPLFGEITSDGRWNGNFEIGSYGPLPSFTQDQRRSSDGHIALGHGRSQSHQDILQPQSATSLSPPKQHTLSHKRSRSDIPQTAPSMPNLNSQTVPSMYPTPPNSGTRNPPPGSRIPVSNRRGSQSQGSAGSSSGPQSRSTSALDNPPAGRNRLSKSPTRKAQLASSQSAKPSGLPRSRYHPTPLATESNGQTLSAKIVAPLPKMSPPLRSSRPRQPVSSATTSASRARAAERYQGPANRDGRRPSEQWLGKPYDANQEKSKRRIPELDKIDFEARRERIQKAISQNLEETRSLESLRAKSRSRQASREAERQVETGAETPVLDSVDESFGEDVKKDADTMPGGWPTPGGLSVDTFNVQSQSEREPEPNTALTEFEMDESPVLGRPPTQEDQGLAIQAEEPTLLTSATYQPARSPAKSPKPAPIAVEKEAPAEEIQSPSVLENVMRMRQRGASNASRSDAEYADDSVPNSAEDSASDLEERWGLGNGLGNGLESVAGSIKIMLDDGPRGPHRPWQREVHEVPQYNQETFAANGFTDSPIEHQDAFAQPQRQPTPRKDATRENTLRAEDFHKLMAYAPPDQIASDPAFAQALEEYQTRGTINPSMLQQMQHHMVDLQRMSANDGSNGFMIQSLLDSILDVQRGQQDDPEDHEKPLLPSTKYEMPTVTPDTPPGWEYTEGTAVVYTNSNDASHEDTPDERIGDREEEDFHVKIRKADEAWERQQRGEYLRLDFDDDDRPMPPPKDEGYTPRSSAPNSATFAPQDFSQGLRISTMPQPDVRGIHSAGDSSESTVIQHRDLEPQSAPALPFYAPPPPPSTSSSTRLPFGLGDLPQMPATYSERGSSELSPRARKTIWGASGSSRPSIDSQRAQGMPPLPGSVSMTSFTESGRQDSMDTDAQSRSTKDVSPSPEHKRLLKRRHIIKELIDTEYTYHQDLKIIEDIYKGTAVPDLIAPEDKKILFGNCDEIEKFSLHFYDELRRAASPVYIPARDKRWMNKRGSYSTTQSNDTTHTSNLNPDFVDEERDRNTTVGQAFLDNLQRMELVYSIYLKNHDAANSRLSALRNTPTVKCWLDECHNNASDITSAWDLDSLLVKPTQRISKYPMLLTQLLETTPQDHPDRERLSNAARDSVSMLTRINEAKKRAELVDQIVNRKRKDSDVRSGIAKAFGRRTEKLKERVGIAEAFQDPEFDQLAHKFGGHFIRLQICMRDVQDYLHRIEKAMDQVNNFAGALDLFTDVSMSSGSELESKWRKYGQAIRELTTIAFADHKQEVQKRLITPMIACIKLHDGPQNAINNRKKRIVDYAKCKAIEKRGEKPDKKTVEASEMYLALNDQLKIELPKLYSFTAVLVQGCLQCFLDIQLNWSNTWERKLRPVLEAADIPSSIQQIEPAFRADYDLIKNAAMELGICNGAALAESANFLSPTITHGDESSSSKRPSTLDSSKRTMSMGSDSSPLPTSAGYKRRSSSYAPGMSDAGVTFAQDGRMRSSSSLSNRGTPTQTPGSAMMANMPWSNANTPTSSFNLSRPATANAPSSQQAVILPPRASGEQQRSPRPTSQATYFTARPDIDDARFSGIFNSAMPPDTPDPTRPTSPRPMHEDTNVLFVCASLFEFSIDKTRKEGGYPYLTYVQGEVFDVIAQKGELWLAKNQDDSSNTLGWIWEQHFVILSQD